MSLTIGSLFSGIGGLELGLERATGARVAFQCEINPYCRAVLAQHWPEAIRFDDVRTLGAHNAPPVDILCGGFPCQPWSNAGQRRGREDERHLWPEFKRIIRELQPRVVVGENVSALLAGGVEEVFGDLAALGFDCVWDCVPAQAIGAPHRRDRVFVIAWRRGLANADGRDRDRRSPDARHGPAAALCGQSDRACGEGDVAHAPRLQPRRGHERTGTDDPRCAGARDVPGQPSLLVDAPRLSEREPADESHTLTAGREARDESCHAGELADARRLGIERDRAAGEVAGAAGAREGEGAERQRDGHTAGDCGEVVAHPPRGARQRRAPRDARHPALGGEGVAHADCAGEPQPEGAERAEWGRAGDGSEGDRTVGVGLADSNGERREERHGLALAARAELGCAPGDDGRDGDCAPLARLGGDADGLPARLDGAFARGIAGVRCQPSRWPSRPGEEQAEWEPPRTAHGVAHRQQRLSALGNAVVPQVAEAIGHVVNEVLACLAVPARATEAA